MLSFEISKDLTVHNGDYRNFSDLSKTSPCNSSRLTVDHKAPTTLTSRAKAFHSYIITLTKQSWPLWPPFSRQRGWTLRLLQPVPCFGPFLIFCVAWTTWATSLKRAPRESRRSSGCSPALAEQSSGCRLSTT
jgi:hypothetical protein